MHDPNLSATRLPPSLWASTAPPAPATTPLPEAGASCDLVVLGAGFTGLAAALHAATRGASVVVLEAAEVGFGASGRNNGLVIPALTRADPDVLLAAFGPEHGRTVVELLRDSAQGLFELVRRHAIDCEAVQTGWLQPAHRASRMALARSRVGQWQRHGADVALLDREAMAALTGSRFWHGGWIARQGGHVNPLALARGMARAALAAGATVHTGTPALALERDGSRWRVRTPQGAVTARGVLVATHSYSGFLVPSPVPAMRRALVPVRSYQMATRPLAPEWRQRVLGGNHAMSDTQGDLHFAHWDAAGRLVTGGALAFAAGYDERLRARIGARLLAMFPQLEAAAPGGRVAFDHVWHGVFAATPDRLPRFVRVDDGVLGWLGCNGRGVALATALGPRLADALLDGDRASTRLPFERLRTIPGHAFAQLGVKLGVWQARRADGRD